MDRKPVISSMIRSVGYDGESLTLEIEFQAGTVYQYANVSKTTYLALMAADSKGHYFEAHIISGRYPCHRLL